MYPGHLNAFLAAINLGLPAEQVGHLSKHPNILQSAILSINSDLFPVYF